MDMTPNVHSPYFPTYEELRAFIHLMDGQSVDVFYAMRKGIESEVGTPQANKDWKAPDMWIPTVLSGEEQALAQRLWTGSQGVVNPRHVNGCWLASSNYQLLSTDQDSVLRLTETGAEFLDNMLGETEKEIDYSEGLVQLLAIVAENGPGKRSDFFPHYDEFLEQYSTYHSPTSRAGVWYERMVNLVSRGLVEKTGVRYQITQDGLNYLDQVSSLIQTVEKESATDALQAIRQLSKEQRDNVRRRIIETISEMNPYLFEALIKRLLEAMGYENVEVTSKSNDGGVDVVADIEVGITLVREVVQVKRHKGNIGRPTLDQLRGSLHRFDATRGTIISSGGFTNDAQNAAFERGAAPITLIDGERLVDLLVENEIGAKEDTIKVLKFAPVDFEIDEEVEEDIQG